MFWTEDTSIPVYDYSLNLNDLKASLQEQATLTSINTYGDCNTLVKISFEEGDTLLFPFFGRHFYTSNIKMDNRCFWYAPIRIHIKKKNILFNDNPISMDSLTTVLQTSHHLFYNNGYSKQQRIEIKWDDHSKFEDRRQILKLVISQVKSIYQAYAKSKFGLPIKQLNQEQINKIRSSTVEFMLYHSFR